LIKGSCRYWIERFRDDFYQRGRSETTWQTDYLKILKKLPPDSSLTAAVLHQIVLETIPNTKSRRRACMVTKQLATFADINYDPKPYQGNYSPKRPQPRDIPTDAAIAAYWITLKNPGWRFIYGLIATYGLRPHEAFQVDYDRLAVGDRVLWVLAGKTGSRRVWAFHPEWFDQFELASPVLPAVNLSRRNDQIGHSATRHFWELKAPFKLYDLRHAWAIRTLEYGLEDALAARQMGHSVEIHNSIYQHWLDEKTQQRAYDRLLSRADRPKPPQ
jgi:integrase